jgi:protein-S-isoprenylcysteine O-methyltransferase Ste14
MIKDVQEHVEREHERRKPAFADKKRKMLRLYPLVVVVSALLLVLSFLFSPFPWSVLFLSFAVLSQAIYWAAFYRTWRSFRRAAKYPSQAFSRIHLFILALSRAVFEYAVTEDILTPIET